MADVKMTAAAVTQSEQRERGAITANGRRRIASPMAYVESCLSRIEEEFLWRFFEAHCFKTGSRPVAPDGTPLGRYADFAEQIDPDAYAKLEIQAFDWVRKYALGRESAMIAELFLRMEGGNPSTTMLDFGGSFVNSHDERVALGGGQGAIRMLGIRIKDAYRDFFRYYSYVQSCEERGRPSTPAGALAEVQREQIIAQNIETFKLAKGLITKADPAL